MILIKLCNKEYTKEIETFLNVSVNKANEINYTMEKNKITNQLRYSTASKKHKKITGEEIWLDMYDKNVFSFIK
jgi:tRNA U34 5-methylaminomethyl-2-thiouridine-forming methyltransferase MnmC